MKNKIRHSLFGILGYPLSHTLSPFMQETAFRSRKIPAFYLALEISPEDFPTFLKKKLSARFSGFNVTVPYKEQAVTAADVLSKQAEKIGAINTLICKGRRWYGENTDVDGLLMSLKQDARFIPAHKKIFVFGGGGAARGAVFALAKGGAREIVVCNRTLSKAARIVEGFKKVFPRTLLSVCPLEDRAVLEAVQSSALVINATSRGLDPEEPSWIPASWIQSSVVIGRKLFYDLIYNPPETKFLSEAKRKGHAVCNGLGMLLYQGALSWELWTGQKAPVRQMKRALLQSLKG